MSEMNISDDGELVTGYIFEFEQQFYEKVMKELQ